MSKLLEFLLGSVLITVFTIAFLFFSGLHYILRRGDIPDCSWRASAKTWIDANGDGHIDRNEPPLGGVEIYVDEVESQIFSIRWPVFTNRVGDVQFNIANPGCSDTLYEIYVNTPEGYRISTRSYIKVNPKAKANLGKTPVYYFGFMPEK